MDIGVTLRKDDVGVAFKKDDDMLLLQVLVLWTFSFPYVCFLGIHVVLCLYSGSHTAACENNFQTLTCSHVAHLN
jgi:hypothetical protein